MISVAKLIRQIRIEVKDINEVKYSDWDILNAMNKCLRLLSNYLSDTNADFVERSVVLPLEEVFYGAPLPEDYISLKRVTTIDGHSLSPAPIARACTEYAVDNGRLYAKLPVVLRYKRSLGEAVEGGSVDIPNFTFDMIVSTTKMMLGGSTEDALFQYITDNAKLLIPHRKYANAKLRMPFRV